jgi:hypothetical protein
VRIPAGEWLPDIPALGNTGLVDVTNAVPGKDHWLPQRKLIKVSDQPIESPVQGVWTANRTQGDRLAFVAFGGKIYRVPSRNGALVDASGPYDYSTAADIRWHQVQSANLSIVTNGVDAIQALDLVAGGEYEQLSPDAPVARYIAQVRDFAVVGYTTDDTDGEQAYRVQWHGFTDGLPDPTNWTTGQADFATINDIGQVQGITGGQFGTIVCETGVAVIRYGANLFDIEVVERRLGTRVPNSVNYYRQLTAYYAPEGWVLFDGSAARKIGIERIDRWFKSDFDPATGDKMWAAVDDIGHMIWAYCGRGHNGVPNRLLRYAPELDRWGKSNMDIDALGSGATFGMSLDDTFFDDLDGFDDNLDDPSLWDDMPLTVAVTTRRLSGFTGSQLDGTFTFGEFQLGGERNRAMLREALVLAKGGTSRMQVATKQKFGEAELWTPTFGERSDGYFRHRIPGRTHQLRVLRSNGWANMQGIDLFAEQLGER